MSQHYYGRRDAEGVANLLTNESVARWQREQGMIDDITIVVAYLNISKQSEDVKVEEHKARYNQEETQEPDGGTPEVAHLPVSPPSGNPDLSQAKVYSLNQVSEEAHRS